MSLKGHTTIIWELCELGDNKIISGADDNKSKKWDLKTQKSEDFCKCSRHISGIVVLKINKVIITSGQNIFLYDLKTKEQESFLDIKV